jgi:hypothetical protein
MSADYSPCLFTQPLYSRQVSQEIRTRNREETEREKMKRKKSEG